MDSYIILILFGALLSLIGIVGGGFSIKEIKIPKVNTLSRVIASILGVLFILTGLYIENPDWLNFITGKSNSDGQDSTIHIDGSNGQPITDENDNPDGDHPDSDADHSRNNESDMTIISMDNIYAINLKSAHGKYLAAEQNGEAFANRDMAGPWEKWTLIDINREDLQSGDKINFLSNHGKYLAAEETGEAIVNRSEAGPWETWTLIDINKGRLLSGDKVKFLSHHGKYLVAENTGAVNANREAAGPWEIWIISFTK